MNKNTKKALAKKIRFHVHTWVPVKLWDSYPDIEEYSLELACVCGAFKIIDAMQLEVAERIFAESFKKKGDL